MIATDQRITPAGVQTVFAGRVSGVRFDIKSDVVWVAVPGALYKLGLDGSGSRITYRGAGGTYSLSADPVTGNMLFSMVGQAPPNFVDPDQPSPSGRSPSWRSSGATPCVPSVGWATSAIGAPAVASRADAAGHRLAVVPLTADDRLAVIDMATGRILDSIALGVAPIASAISADGATAWVSEMAGRQPTGSDLAASQCCNARAESIRVDDRGIAAEGAVVRVDLEARSVVTRIRGRPPSHRARLGHRPRPPLRGRRQQRPGHRDRHPRRLGPVGDRDGAVPDARDRPCPHRAGPVARRCDAVRGAGRRQRGGDVSRRRRRGRAAGHDPDRVVSLVARREHRWQVPGGRHPARRRLGDRHHQRVARQDRALRARGARGGERGRGARRGDPGELYRGGVGEQPAAAGNERHDRPGALPRWRARCRPVPAIRR